MTPKPSRGRRRGLFAGASTLIVAAAAILAVTALAASPKSSKAGTLNVGHSVAVGTKHESIAVNAHGAAVYELLPETTKHLLCTTASGCPKFWPPVTVSEGAKITKGAGLKGKVGSFTHNGITQLTLNGHPLYTFALDKVKGTAKGDGLMSFGGTWHVFKEGQSQSTNSTSTPAPMPGPTGYTAPTSSATTTTTASSSDW
jgi:predicted lipoprotein with Yx(FWY)xxD motif